MKTWTDVEGWCDFPEVYAAEAARLPPNAVAVEVGSWLGRSTALFASLLRDGGRTDVTFYSVDWGLGNTDKAADVCQPALTAGGRSVAGQLAANLHACGVADYVYQLVATSTHAARLFADASVDFAFIDANHTYESALEDIKAWWPKIKPGGAMAGHDYDCHWPDVVRAVEEFFGRPCPHPARATCWGVVKPT